MKRTFRFDIDGKLKEVSQNKPLDSIGLEAFFFHPPVPSAEAFEIMAAIQREAERAMGLPPLDTNSVRGVWGTKG